MTIYENFKHNSTKINDDDINLQYLDLISYKIGNKVGLSLARELISNAILKELIPLHNQISNNVTDKLNPIKKTQSNTSISYLANSKLNLS
jgi:hypothetical protein